MNKTIFPIAIISVCILIIWYGFSIILNSSWAFDKAERNEVQLTFIELVDDTWSQKKPKLPAPHQVGQEMWKTIFYKKVTSKRSLVYHGWITLSATLSGFLLGTILGICLALAIVHDKATDLSVMPWIITSQTIPILALAPMIIVVLSSIGFTGLMPKAVISMYLSFFPIVVGMVKGLRSPDLLEIDQMKTWSASRFQILMKLRFPKSIPYLFTSLKLGMAASLVGAIVGELPSGAIAGLGARMLSGSYYGQTIQIWSALFTAAILAASLVGLIGAIQSLVSKRMMVTQ
jgi:NitT/TauT family transport system permease protein